MADAEDLEEMMVTALNALASSTDGTLPLPDLEALLETRLGSIDEEADSAQSVESREFRKDVRTILAELEKAGYATADDTGALIRITPEGRAFVGR